MTKNANENIDLRKVHSYTEEHTNRKEFINRSNITKVIGIRLFTTPYKVSIPFKIFFYNKR